MARESYSYRLELATVAPIGDAAWVAAGPALKREFYRACLQIALEVKDEELARGLDKNGRPLAPISQYTRDHRHSAMGPASPDAPPLTPAYGLSRTRSLLTGRLEGSALLFYWKADQEGRHWGRILGYHRQGRRGPQRDVIGLAPDSVRQIQLRARAWWVARQFGPVTGVAPRKPVGAIPKFTHQHAAKYRPKNPLNAMPKSNKRVSQLNVNDNHYTFSSGNASQVRRMIANGSFTGFRQIGPAPGRTP